MPKPNQGTIQNWILIVIIVLVVGGGIFVWQYWGVKEKVKAPEEGVSQEEVLPQEEVEEEAKNEEKEKEVPEEVSPADETADWKTYRNEEYGFEVKYPVSFRVNDNYGVFYLSSLDYTDTKIYILVDKNLSVPLDGTFGGRLQHSESQQPDSKVFSEKVGDFNKDYFIAYGGMGSWDVVINTHQYKNGKYYIISLYRGRQLGAPGSGTENSKQEIVNRTLTEMRNKDTEPTKIFNQILSTFRFID